MKSGLLKLFLACSLFCPALAYAVPPNIVYVTEPRGSLTVGQNNQTVSITGDGNILVNSNKAAIHNNYPDFTGYFLNTVINIDTTLSTNGLIASGEGAEAINFYGTGGSLSSLTIDSGTVTSNITNSFSGTISLVAIDASFTTINVGQSSGGEGTISNTGDGGNAIYFSGVESINLTINNKATGTISSLGNAIKLYDDGASSSLTLLNSGTITAASGYDAISLTGYSANVTNSGDITGNITASDLSLSLTNTGTITGNIDLGSNADSIVNLNAGTITGDITMGNASQNFVFRGGDLSGNIYSAGNGLGTFRIAEDFSTSGNIGGPSSLFAVSIDSGKTLDVNSYINADSINVDAGTLNINNGTIYGTIKLSSGTLNIDDTYFTANGDITNNFDSGNNATINIISDGTLDLSTNDKQITASGTGATIDINLDNGSTLILGSGSSTGNFKGLDAGGQGTLNFTKNFTVNGTIGFNYALSSVNLVDVAEEDAYTVNLNNDLTAFGFDVGDYSTLVASESDISAFYNIVLGDHSVLTLTNNSILEETDGGYVFFGDDAGVINISNSTINNNIVFDADNGTLNVGENSIINGNIHMDGAGSLMNITGDFNAGGDIVGGFGTVVISADRTLDLLDNDLDIYATTLNENSTLRVGNGILGGTIDGDDHGFGKLEVTQNVVTAGNIGNSYRLNEVIIASGKTLNIADNNNTLKANTITLNQNSNLIVGNGELVGNIDGDDAGYGTVEFNYSAPSWGIANFLSTDAAIGSTKKIDSIIIADNTRLTTTGNLLANTINVTGSLVINGGTLGAYEPTTIITLGSSPSGTLHDEQYDGRLDLESGQINGSIQAAADGVGRFYITTSYHNNYLGIGSADAKLETLYVANGGWLESNSYIGANHIRIAGGRLRYSGGSIVGVIEGGNDAGIFDIQSDFATTTNIGSNYSLNNILIDSGSTLTVNNDISSTNIQVRGTIDFTNTSHTINANIYASSQNRWDSPTFDAGFGHHVINGNFETDSSSNYKYDKNIIAISLNDSSSNSTASIASTGYMEIDSYSKLHLNLSDLTVEDIVAGATTYNLLSGASGSNISTFDAPNISVNGGYNRIGLFKLYTTVADDVMTLNFAELQGNTLNVGATAHDGIVASIDNSGTSNDIDYTNVHLVESGAYVTMGSGTINGNVTLVNGSVLTAGTGYILGTINADSVDNVGTLIFGQNFTSYGDIGNEHYLSEVILDNVAQEYSYTVNLNNNLSANSLVVGDYARLNVNSGSTVTLHDENLYVEYNSQLYFDEAILNARNLNYDDSYATVNISDSTLNFSDFGIRIDNNGTLNIGYGSNINGSIDAAENTDTINFSGSFTSNGDITGDGTINISEYVDFASRNNSITADSITLYGNGTLNVGTGTITGTINGDDSESAHGTIIFSSNYTATQNIGELASLESVYINANSILNLHTNDNSLRASNIYLDNNAELIIGSGDVYGNIKATYYDDEDINQGRGTLNILSNFNLHGTIGDEDNHHLNIINLGVLNAENNLTFNLNNNVVSRSININDYTTTNLSNEATMRADIDINIKAATVNLADDSLLTAQNIYADSNSIINMSYSAINGEVSLNNNSQLNVNENAAINGNINIGDASSVNFSSTFTTNGNINNYASLLSQSAVSLLDGSYVDLSVHNNSLAASTITLYQESQLKVGTGAVSGDVDGDDTGHGLLTFTAESTFNSDIGSDKALNSVVLQGVVEGSYTVHLNGDLSVTNSLAINDNVTLLASGSTINSGTFDNYLGNNSALVLTNGSVFNENSENGFRNDGSYGTISLTDSTFNGKIIVAANGALNVNASSNINGDIDVANSGYINFNDNFTTNGNITNSDGASAISIFNGSTLNLSLHGNSLAATTITLSDNSTLNAGAGDISGAISLGDGASLNTSSGAINGTINGSDDDRGTLNLQLGFTTNGNIGAVHKLRQVSVAGETTLDLATNNNSLSATYTNLGAAGVLNAGSGNIDSQITMQSSSTLNAGSGNIAGEIKMTSGSVINTGTGAWNVDVYSIDEGDAYGTVNVNNNLTTNGDLGYADYSLVAINVANFLTLDLAQNDNVLAAVNTKLNFGATLNIGEGAIFGNIDGYDNNGYGQINFSKNNTITSDIGDSYTLNAIYLSDSEAGYMVNFNNNYLGVGSIGVGSNASFIASNSEINASALYSGNNSTITLENGSVFTGEFFGYDGSNATFNITDSTVNSYVEMYDSSTLNLNSNAVINGVINLGDDSTLNINSDFTTNGNINNQYGGDSTVALLNGAELDLSVNNNSLTATTITLSENSILTAGSGDIFAENITLGNDSTFNTGTGAINGAIDGFDSGEGILNVLYNFTVNNNIGALHNLYQVNVSSGVTLDLSTNNKSLSTNYTFLNGTLNAGDSADINSTILMGNGSVLNARAGDINGDINSNAYESSYGTVNVFNNLTTNGNLGVSGYSLSAVNIDDDVTLDLAQNNNSLVATTVTLNDGAVLNLGSGALYGNIQSNNPDNHGTVNFNQNLETSANIGTSGFALNTININEGAALTADGELRSGNIVVDGTLNANNNIEAGNLYVYGTLNLGNNDEYSINVSNTVGYASSTINAGEVAHTFNGNFTTFSDSILGFTLTDSSQGSIASNLSTIADGTKLNLDISSFNFENIDETTTYNLVLGGDASIAAIANANINLGEGYGSNTFDGYRLFTSVVEDKLVLNFGLDETAFIVPENQTRDFSELDTSITQATIIVRSNGVLSMGSGDIVSGNTTLGTNATLNTGTGIINGNIDGNAAGRGNLNILHDFTALGDIGATQSLNTVSIADNMTLTAEGHDLIANTINIGNGTLSFGGSESTLASNIAGTSATDIFLDEDGSFEISSSTNNSINANINGIAGESEVGLGAVIISQSISLADLHIGQTRAISDLVITGGSNVYLGSSVNADDITIDQSSLHMLDGTVTTGNIAVNGTSTYAYLEIGEELGEGATVNGNITINGSYWAEVYLQEHSTINGNVEFTSFGDIYLQANSVLNGGITSAEGDDNSVYINGSEASVSEDIDGVTSFYVNDNVSFDTAIDISVRNRIQVGDYGSLTTTGDLSANRIRLYDGSSTSARNITTSGDYSYLRLYDTAALTTTGNISVSGIESYIQIRDGASLTTSGRIDGGSEEGGYNNVDLFIGEGSTLTLNSGASLYASIDDYNENYDGLSHGSIILADSEESSALELQGDIGYNYKIASIEVGQNRILETNSYSVYTDALSLLSDSNVIVGNVIGGNSLHSSTVTVNTKDVEKGIIGVGQSALWMDTLANSSLTITSGLVTSNFSESSTLGINGADGSTTNIVVGQDSLGAGDSAAILSNTAGGNILYFIKDANNHVDISINNKATGSITVENGTAIYLLSSDGADSNSTLDITNEGLMLATGEGRLINSQYATSINNSGTMEGQVYVSSAVPVTVVNSGTMSGGLYLDSTEPVSVTNSGTINGNIVIGSNESSSLTMSDGAITGNIAMNNYYQSIIFNGGIFTGDIYGIEGYAGSVTVNDVAFGRNDATTQITSPIFTTNENSFMSLNVSSEFTSLTVVGEAMIAPSTTLRLTIDQSVTSTSSFTLIDATTLTASALSNSNIKINGRTGGSANNYGGFIFSTRIEDNKLILFASGNAVIPRPVFSNPNNGNVYDVVKEIENPTGALQTIQDYITNVDISTAQKEEVIKSISPTVDRGTNTVITDNNIALANLNSARLSDSSAAATIVESSFVNNLFGRSTRIQTLEPLRDNNIKTAAPLAMAFKGDDALNKAMWIQTFGSNINQTNSGSGDGYKANSIGLAIGFDQKLNKDFTLGLSSSYSQSTIKSNEAGKSTVIDTYQVSIYTGYDTKSYFLNSSVGFSLNNYNSTRQIPTAGVVAKGDYSGQSYFARGELGKNFKFANDLVATPSIILTAAHNMVGEYTETGAETLNLHVKNKSTNFFEGRAGIELSKLFITQKKTKIRPQASLSYGYDFIGDEQKTTSNFVGQNTSFALTSANVAQGSFKFGTGVGFYTKNDLTVSLNYGFEKRIDYTAQSGWLRMRLGF